VTGGSPRARLPNPAEDPISNGCTISLLSNLARLGAVNGQTGS
jgi:hypothetical protein